MKIAGETFQVVCHGASLLKAALEIAYLRAKPLQMSLFLVPFSLYLSKFLFGVEPVFARLSNRIFEFISFESQ